MTFGTLMPRLLRRLRGAAGPRWIEVDELCAQPAGAAVIDVREADEFIGPLGHIAGASNIPVAELERCLPEIDAFRERPVILVCRTDRRSAIAAALLCEAGFGDVRVLRGGMERWNRCGLPVARAIATDPGDRP